MKTMRTACMNVIQLTAPNLSAPPQVEDNQRDLIDPAVKGTENVMASILKSKGTVRRVILTSSVLCKCSSALNEQTVQR